MWAYECSVYPPATDGTDNLMATCLGVRSTNTVRTRMVHRRGSGYLGT